MIRSQLAHQLKDEVTALRRFALFLTKSYEDADDLVQDTLERALIKAHLFDGENLRSWLFTVCRRIFLNQTRRTKSRGVSVTIDDAPASALRTESNQEAVLDWSRLAENFDRLPQKDRDLMRLIVIEGARYEDAAAAMDVPVGTVRSRLSRARARLQQMMEVGEPVSVVAAAA